MSYHLLDTHSDVVGLLSPLAANEGTRAYDAYGGVLGTTGTQGMLGYQGDITDPTTGQVDMGTRRYAPGQGRFTSRDVLFGEMTSPMSLNQFAFGAMNPVTMWDPTGMRAECESDNGCDNAWQAQKAWYKATQSTDGTMTSSSDSNPFVPAPEPPAPVPTYNRESYSVLDVCARRCGDGSLGFDSTSTGTLDAEAFE